MLYDVIVIVFAPWNFDFIHHNNGNLIIFFGKDTALGTSFLRASGHRFISEQELLDDINILYDVSLFESELYPICSHLSQSKYISDLYLKHKFSRKVMLYVDVLKEQHECIEYIKCDPMTKLQQKRFIKFHSNILNIDLPSKLDLAWIKNLDDIRFASILHTIGAEYEHFESVRANDPWVQIRVMQYRSKYRYVWKHFEQWAKDNSPDNTCLNVYIEQIENHLSDNKK